MSNGWGVGMAIIAAIVSNIGVQYQKDAHNTMLDPKERQEGTTVYVRQSQWICGFVLVIFGALGDFEALSFAPQSLVAAVGGGCTVVVNVGLSVWWHQESFSKNDLYGTSCILLGIVIVSLYSPADQDYSLQQLLDRFQNPMVLMYFVGLCGLILTLGFLILDSTTVSHENVKLFALKESSSRYNEMISQRLRSTILKERTPKRLDPYYYAMMSGIVGSISMLLGKCASELLHLTILGQNQFVYWNTYYILGAMGLTIALQTHWLNQALRSENVSSIFPVFQVFWIGFGVIGGIVFYNEFSEFDNAMEVIFAIAFCLIFTGVYYLAKHEEVSHIRNKSHLTSSDSQPFSEAKISLLIENKAIENEYVDIEICDTSYRPPALLQAYQC